MKNQAIHRAFHGHNNLPNGTPKWLKGIKEYLSKANLEEAHVYQPPRKDFGNVIFHFTRTDEMGPDTLCIFFGGPMQGRITARRFDLHHAGPKPRFTQTDLQRNQIPEKYLFLANFFYKHNVRDVDDQSYIETEFARYGNADRWLAEQDPRW